jgi:hypothetical protein
VGKKGKEAVDKGGGYVKVKGRLDRREMERVLLEEVREVGKMADKVVIGGPCNSLFKHGRAFEKEFCPDRTIKMGENGNGEVNSVMQCGISHNRTVKWLMLMLSFLLL